MKRAAARLSELCLSFTADVGAGYVPYLRPPLLKAHTIIRPALQELSVALVNDRRMSELHEQFMHLSGPTDVLTFPLDFDSRHRCIAGEIVVCLPQARRTARQQRVAMRDELLLYCLHGLLHLCGFDDRTAAGFMKMHRREDFILTQLGIGPVFFTSAPPRPRGAFGAR